MTRASTLPFACLALLVAPLAFAQPAQPTAPASPAPPKPSMTRGGDRGPGGMGGSMGIVPPGTWWKNPDTITALSLSADQQKKMDDMFLQSRIALIHLHASLEEEQLKLEPLLNVNPPDQTRALAQISKIADLRADLEKANAKMLLGLRSVLTADQWTRLQAQQHAHHDRPDRAEGRVDGRGQGNGQSHGPQGRPGQQGPQNGPAPPAAPDVE